MKTCKNLLEKKYYWLTAICKNVKDISIFRKIEELDIYTARGTGMVILLKTLVV